jgi:mono/diheme cytochrome c family protein
MTWPALAGAAITSLVVPAGIVLAASAAWLITYLGGDQQPSASPGARHAYALSPPHLAGAADPIALEQGRVYYAQLCVGCHGTRGDGAGEWAYRVNPRPANLTGARTRERSDAALYQIISSGVPGTAMRGWARDLSDAQRQQLVAYVRHLGSGRVGDARHE